MTFADLEHETSSVTLEELLETEATQDRTSCRPHALALSQLRIAPQVFQWRKFDSELAAEEAHVKELVRVLNSGDEPLDPILVTAIGDAFYVVDGHHRVLAYRRAGRSDPVPVSHFEGTVEEARLEALKLNIKNKLPMTGHDKFEAAWTLVKEGPQKFSKKKIWELTTISKRTVANMRAVLKEHPEAREVTWRQAKRLQFEQRDDLDHEDWLEAAAKKMADQILKNVGPDFRQRPDVVALALSMIDASLPLALVREWPEEAKAFVEEMTLLDI